MLIIKWKSTILLQINSQKHCTSSTLHCLSKYSLSFTDIIILYIMTFKEINIHFYIIKCLTALLSEMHIEVV